MFLGTWLLACQSPSTALEAFCDAERASGAAEPGLTALERQGRMAEYLGPRMKNEEARALMTEVASARALDKVRILERGLAAHGVTKCTALDDMRASETTHLEAWCTLPEWCPGCIYHLRPDEHIVERLGNPDVADEARSAAEDVARTAVRAVEIGVSPCPLEVVLNQDAATASNLEVNLPVPEQDVKRVDDERVRVAILVYNPTPHPVASLTVQLSTGQATVSFIVNEAIPSHQHRWLVERGPNAVPTIQRGVGLPLTVGPGDVPEVGVRVQGRTQ